MGKASQRKGRTAELELARLLNDNGIPAVAGEPLNYGTVPDIRGVAGVHCECKRAEQLRLTDWMKQAEDDAEKFRDGAPVIFWRKNHSPWMVFMKLADWIRFYQKGGCDL